MKACSSYVVALVATASLSACGDGLIYSEWTSINLASVRVNNDPATPVAIKLGFDRNVVAVAPRIGGTVTERTMATADGNGSASPSVTPGGEAVSQFSTFSVNVGTPFIVAPATTTAPRAPATNQWQTLIHSRFASGAAALAIADTPEAVAAVMGLRVVSGIARTPPAAWLQAWLFDQTVSAEERQRRRDRVTAELRGRSVDVSRPVNVIIRDPAIEETGVLEAVARAVGWPG
jgi:hypothetical protein